jgi:hypothetical protein
MNGIAESNVHLGDNQRATNSAGKSLSSCLRHAPHSLADGTARTAPSSREAANMEDHETRRKVIRQWMTLPKDKRQTAEQAAEFAKKAVEQNKLQASQA